MAQTFSYTKIYKINKVTDRRSCSFVIITFVRFAQGPNAGMLSCEAGGNSLAAK